MSGSRLGSVVGAAVLAAMVGAAVMAPATPGTAPQADPVDAGSELRPTPATPAGHGYVMPIDGEVVAPFDGPDVPWGPGHRGVDISASHGATVVAAADGVVAFVGTVVDRPVLSIDHADGIRTTYEPVHGSVEVGDAVSQGEPIGTVTADGSHCAPDTCLHWGARVDEDYVDPLTLLGEQTTRLYPTGLPTKAPAHRPRYRFTADASG